jgi:hypothetical protein
LSKIGFVSAANLAMLAGKWKSRRYKRMASPGASANWLQSKM